MSEHLFVTNNLIEVEKGLWLPSVDVDKQNTFGYSDGDIEEDYLLEVINKSDDLSSDSIELASHARDWSSLYHFSPKRANILRGLNIRPGARVLEIGAGCGAITRYLAEQGCVVHSVEGSFRRAQIARARTKEMDNVEVICSNATTLVWPKQSYDIVLFVGVLEYSGRFIDQTNLSHQEAVLALLDKAANAVTINGTIFVAIENRMGLKYQYGADEDHFSRPYIGLRGYPTSDFAKTDDGVQTYSKSEWQCIISHLGERRNQYYYQSFYYPFPDYKLPVMNLFDSDYAPEVEHLFDKVNSYDPTSDWSMPVEESALWKQAYREGYVANIANSFAILISSNSETLNNMKPLKSCQFKDDMIHPKFQKYIALNKSDDVTKLAFHQLNHGDQKILNIITLEQNWLKRLTQETDIELFISLVDQAHRAMLEQSIDANMWFMSNTIYAEKGELMFTAPDFFHDIRFKYKSDEVARLRQLLICLIDFASRNENLFHNMRQKLQFEPHSSWADILFLVVKRCGYNEQDWRDCIRGVIKFYESYWQYKDIHRFLLQKVTVSSFKLSKIIRSKVYWSHGLPEKNAPLNVFSETLAKPYDYPQTFLLTTHQFYMDDRATVLRYDPCDQEFFNDLNNLHLEFDKKIYVHSIRLIDAETKKKLWELDGESLVKKCIFHNLQCVNESKQIFQVIGLDPQIVYIDKSFYKSEQLTESKQTAPRPVIYEVTMQWLD